MKKMNNKKTLEFKTPPPRSIDLAYSGSSKSTLRKKKNTQFELKYLCLSARKGKLTFYPSPISKKRFEKRADSSINLSFERNQSLPTINRKPLHSNERVNGQLRAMDKIRVDGSNGLRFPLRRVKGLFAPGSCSPHSASLVASASSESNLRIPKYGINPNKAVFTIDSKTSRILIVNNKACQLLGFTSKELCNMQFSELLTTKNKSHVCALAEVQLNSEDGTIVLLSGKVVEMITKTNINVAVSLWIRQIDNDGRCLAVAEPVERRVCQFVVDHNGLIMNVDYDSLIIFQFETTDQLIGTDICTYIPAIILPDIECNEIPKQIRKQKATGKTEEGISFPLCLLISHHESSADTTDSGLSNQNSNLFTITVWVFQNLSGLIVLDDQGVIESCNHHFSMLMFGYAQSKINGQHISNIIPYFGQDIEYLGFSRSRNITDSSMDNDESGTETDLFCYDDKNNPELSEAEKKPISCHNFSEIGKNELNDTIQEEELVKSFTDKKHRPVTPTKGQNSNCTESNSSMSNENELLTPVNDLDGRFYSLSMNESSMPVTPTYNSDTANSINITTLNSLTFITSTPGDRRASNISATNYATKCYNYADGKYKGEAIHSDGNLIEILYTVSNQVLPCGRKVFCVWLCRDPDTVYDCGNDEKHQNLTFTFNSVTSTVENSLGQAIKNTAAQNSSRPNSVVLVSQCEEEQVSGDFSKMYTTLKQIGKGAYGYVKMAYRNSDRLLVVAKFILKDKLCPQFMISPDGQKDIPMEIYLLTTVKHPNIVTVYDVFENEKFFQLVMEKHGSGMDLFEFIDRRPLIDEKLGSFIFRQIADAVNYLHSLNILHRDIKDENIIIDQNFHIKLIDFGSATFMEEGKLYSTFYGTTEYCSPEVLAGNKYAGPELEMWSLGVTLYVLMFFENPFIDVEETLKSELLMPCKVSTNLEKLLASMLEKDPNVRCTMRQLISNPWIIQEVNLTSFDFSWIVPCEPHESNPEKYFSGHFYSSATGLSTTSPQDSLSLVDEDSIIDGDDEDLDKLSIDNYESDKCVTCNSGSTAPSDPIEKLPVVNYAKSQITNDDEFVGVADDPDPVKMDPQPSTSTTNRSDTIKPGSNISTENVAEENTKDNSYQILSIEVNKSDNSDSYYDFDFWEEDECQESFS